MEDIPILTFPTPPPEFLEELKQRLANYKHRGPLLIINSEGEVIKRIPNSYDECPVNWIEEGF
jgi:hypothetical protein